MLSAFNKIDFNMLKRLCFLSILLSILSYNVKSEKAFYFEPGIFASGDDFFLHTVERGQTVYSIAGMYRVTVDDIYRLNPGSVNGIQIGSSLKIPQVSGSYYYHTIQPKETLYSVSKLYGMKGEDIISVNPGLSVQTFTIGKTIRIPINRVTTPMEGKNEEQDKRLTNALLNQIPRSEDIPTIQVALLLPFGLQEGNSNENISNRNRMIEYYEGILLALYDLKKKKISIDLQVHDIGNNTNAIPAILKKESMQQVHLIIGGLSDKQIKLISDFSRERNIPYVIPFTSKSDEPLNNPFVYQINTPHSYLYSKAALAFCKKYAKSNIIFFVADSSSDKMDFIKLAQEELKQKKIPYQTISYSDFFMPELQSLMKEDENNVIVPSDDTPETLTKLTAPLKNILELNPDRKVSLFGYPGWQVYGNDFSNDFFRLNAGFYSVFYADPTSPEIKSFYNKFNQWYSRELINSFPKYGILGYDTGMFFIQLLNQYGTSFNAHINQLKYKGIQTDFYFERVNNWGGFINTGMYIVTFNPDYTITKSLAR